MRNYTRGKRGIKHEESVKITTQIILESQNKLDSLDFSVFLRLLWNLSNFYDKIYFIVIKLFTTTADKVPSVSIKFKMSTI